MDSESRAPESEVEKLRRLSEKVKLEKVAAGTELDAGGQVATAIDDAKIEQSERLGGLLHSYRRAA